jgi:short-subunit dehydrogenase
MTTPIDIVRAHYAASAQGHIQAVLPAATRTEIWDHAGVDINTLRGVMEVGELVDAALVGFDRRELVTIPPLPESLFRKKTL